MQNKRLEVNLRKNQSTLKRNNLEKTQKTDNWPLW